MNTHRSIRYFVLLACFAIAVAAVSASSASIPAPAAPAQYDVQLRYQINAFRNERLTQYFAMVKHFDTIGFQRNPGAETEPDDPNATRMSGVINSTNARKLLEDRHVRTILLVPKGSKLPADATPVRVQIELVGGFGLERQRIFADQTRTVLATLGFSESVGYDNRGHTRLVGMLPANKLEGVLEDLRKQPVAQKLPPPFETRSPIAVVEVFPTMPAPKAPPAPLAVPKGQELLSITPDLRLLLGNEAEAAKPVRMECILTFTPAEESRRWQSGLIATVPDLVIEGRVGPLVSVNAPARYAPALASLPQVSTVRLPRSARPQPDTGLSAMTDSFDPLKSSGVAGLHARGAKGKGIRVAVIDSDFRGWESLVGKQLPKATKIVDLTTFRNVDLHADPFPGSATATGWGTRSALALMKAAPEAELTLIRIDAAAPYQLYVAARALNGDPVFSESIEERQSDLDSARAALRERRIQLTDERRTVLDNFSQDDETVKKREAFFKKEKEFDKEEHALNGLIRRYLQLRNDLRNLHGIKIVANGLTWSEGQPVDGSSALSRYFDDQPFHAATWFQATGDTRGQSWASHFRDVDGNGVMEFAPLDEPLKPGRWSQELNFLGWQSNRGAAAELPAKTRIRVSAQWSELHDPTFLRNGEDVYREPLSALRLVLLRQRDPAGAQLPADDMEVVAYSAGLPQRLSNKPDVAVYEQSIEYVVDASSRYALRVEGKAPTGTRPASIPGLASDKRIGELRPRVFVQTLDGAGRAVFTDYSPTQGTVGVPADAHGVVTVGAATNVGQPRAFSAGGPPLDMELASKPRLYSFDLGGGASTATGFAAGIAAAALSTGLPRAYLLSSLEVQPGGLLKVPVGWPARTVRK